MEIKLKAKSVYGKVLVYPVCEKSNLLIRLTGKKTFDDTDMFVLERLGYSVSWEAEILEAASWKQDLSLGYLPH